MQPYTGNFKYEWLNNDTHCPIKHKNLEAIQKSLTVIAYCTCGDPKTSYVVAEIYADTHENAVHLLNVASLHHIVCGALSAGVPIVEKQNEYRPTG
jgi:hypothetical protein